MPRIYDDPKDQPRVEEAFEPSGEDEAVEAYEAAQKPRPHTRGTEPIKVAERVTSFSEESMRFAPATVGHVVTRLPTDNQTAGWIGNLMSEATPYLQDYFKFAGVPGHLMRARMYVQAIRDPDAREAARRFLENLQDLPEDQQAELMFYLQGYRAPVSRETPILGRGPAPQPEMQEAAGVAELIRESLGPTDEERIALTPGGEDDLRFDPDNAYEYQKNFISHLSRMFPGLEIDRQDEGMIERLAEGGTDWIVDHQGAEAVLDTVHDILSQRTEDDKPYSLGALGVDALRILGQSSYAAGDIGFDAAGTITRAVPFVGEEVADFAGEQARAAEHAISKAITPVMSAGLKPSSIDPITGEPVYSLADQRVMEARAGAFTILAGLTTIGLGSAIGRAGRRVRTVRRAAGKAGAAAQLAEKRSIHRTGPLGQVQELYRAPIRVVVREIDRQLVHLARDPEKWFGDRIYGRQGKLLIETFHAARKRYPGDASEQINKQIGFVKSAYGSQMPDTLIRNMLTETSDQGMRRVFMDTIMNSEAGTKAIAKFRRQRSRVATQLRELQHPEKIASRAARLEEAEAKFRRLREEGRRPDVSEDAGRELIEAKKEIDRIRGEENQIAQLQIRELDLDWKIKTTFDDDPVLQYPKQNVIRAAVQYAPVTKFSRFMNKVFVRSWMTAKFDPAKFIDEIARFPELYVPGTHNAPVDALARNTQTLSTFMRRAGVDSETVHLRMGQLGETKTSIDFYDLVEKQIFGEGGDIDRALRKSVSPELRSRLVNLHDTPIESRTYSRTSATYRDQYGTVRAQRNVLGRQDPVTGEETPLPSRPTEMLHSVRLPDIDRVIEADSWISRGISRLERHGKVSGAAHMSVWRAPKFILRASTLVMKPLVMAVRLPAMMMRIQMEQALRSSSFGYKPFKGLPDGLSLFPGGIPIPTVHAVRVARNLFKPGRTKLFGMTRTGNTALGRTRIHSKIFNDEGWRLLDPDPRYDGFTSPDSTDIGMFASEMHDDFPIERVWESTQEFRNRRRAPKTAHWEAYRKELEQAHADFVDRKLAQVGLDVDAFLAWAQRDTTAARFIDLELKPQLEVAFPPGGIQGVPDGHTMHMSAVEAANYVEFPAQMTTGRTFDQTEALRAELADGYPEGWDPIEMEFNPRTGEALIREGHHRIGILAEENQSVPIKIKRVNRIERGSVRKEAGEVTANELDELVRDLSGGAGQGMFAAEIQPGSLAELISRKEPGPVGSLVRGLSDEESTKVLAGLARIREAKAHLGADVPRRFGTTNKVPEDLLARDRAPVTDPLRVWAERRVEYLRGLTKDDPRILNTIATGKTRAHTRLKSDFAEDGSSIHAKYDQLQEKVDTISIHLRELYLERNVDNTYKIVALQGERLDALKRIDRITRENPDLLQGMKAFDLADKHRWRNYTAEQWAEANMELPDRLLVDKRVRGVSHDGGRLDDAERLLGSLNTMLYRPFKLLTYADEHGTRGSLFTRLYRENNEVLKRRGYDDKTAAAIAHARAAEKTRDIMYDLSARTSVQRAFRDIMWFAPAWQEVLYTWFVKIPSEAYWVPGMTSLSLKAAGLLQLLEGTGVMRENANKEKVLIIPGLDTFVEKITGKKVPPITFGKVSGLNIVTTSPIPGLSAAGNFALGKAATKWGGLFKDISDIFQPYGPETTLLPTPITFLWEAVLGTPPPFEALGPDKIKADFDRSMDIGIQYAFAELQNQGITPPRPDDFGTRNDDGTWKVTKKQEAAYEKAATEYIHELMDLGKRYQQGISFVRLIGSTVSPMQLYTTNKEREQWEKFWDSFIVPAGFGDQGLSDRQRDLIDSYIGQNPGSFAHSVYYRGQGEKTRDLPFAESQDDAFFDAQLTGESVNLSPREFVDKILSIEANRYYQAEYNRQLREISPTLDPWELLTSGFEKKEALTELMDRQENWKQMNPEAAATAAKQSALWKKNNDIPIESWRSERIGRALHYFRMISGQLTGEEKVRPDFVKDAQREMGILLSEEGEFAAPNTPEEKQLEWYFNEVYSPYLDKIVPLYERAQQLDSAGLPAGDVYDQIRTIANESQPKYKGQSVPVPEAVSFGNRSPFERKAAIWSWRTRPIQWLSEFQMAKAGYGSNPRVLQFMNEVSEYDADMYADIRKRDIHYASNEYDDIIAARDNYMANLARKSGPDVLKLWQMSESPPVYKLNYFGFGSNIPEWGKITQGADQIVRAIQANPDDISIKGFSEFASYHKAYFYRAVAQARNENKALDTLFENLSYSFPLDDGTYRRDATLYEAIFFGNFNTDYIPFDVAAAASDLA